MHNLNNADGKGTAVVELSILQNCSVKAEEKYLKYLNIQGCLIQTSELRTAIAKMKSNQQYKMKLSDIFDNFRF